jgi:hypothetical protein
MTEPLKPGHTYSVGPNGEHTETTSEPDVWLCRRKADFPSGALPETAVEGECSVCRVAIGYRDRSDIKAPKVCFQCEGYEPLPMGN